MNSRNKPEDAWLLDAEVKYRIEEAHGRWQVSLIFIDTHDPTHFLVKQIGDYRTEKLAKIYARNMQQTAAKDFRGTQKVNPDDYPANNN